MSKLGFASESRNQVTYFLSAVFGGTDPFDLPDHKIGYMLVYELSSNLERIRAIVWQNESQKL